MTDRYLFKAKRISNGEWVEGFVSRPFSKNTEDNITNYCFNALDEMGFVSECIVSADTLCQFTGLTDKNGNKIWENDVVWVGGTDRAIVIFSEKYSGYILQPIEDFYFDSPMLVDNVDIIDNIIGNKFDNPDC